jgi:hypothetical protein
MISLTLRQFRAQALAALAVLAVVAVILGLTGLHVAHLYDASGLVACRVHCPALAAGFLHQVNASLLNHLPLLFGTALVAVPAVIGVFWGVPLVTSGLNPRTHQLALGPGVSRTHWLAVRLGVIGVAGMITAGLFSLMVTWSAGPIDRANMNRLLPEVFSERGIVPVGYAAFAVALGVTAGALIRRTVPAMAVTLAVFAAVQFAMRGIRAHLIPPAHLVSAITGFSSVGFFQPPGSSTVASISPTGQANIPGAWILSTQTVDAAGRVVTSVPLSPAGAVSAVACSPSGPQGPGHACLANLAQHGYRQLVTYQPASRFWAFQWYETAIFGVLAIALTGFCFWWVRNRLADQRS